MPQSPNGQSGNDSSVAPSSDLGANEWLVEEMQEQYDKDPASVAPEWAAYFGNGTLLRRQGCCSRCHGRPGRRRLPRPLPRLPLPLPLRVEPDRAPRHRPLPRRLPQPSSPAPKSTPRPAAAAAEPATGTTKPVAKDPKPAAPAKASDEPTFTVLRGAPARTVANMDASLTVPTATSVRSVPVKLLWDNRTVINNHLARARGGKVSFTHLIGYALVKALATMPEMNVGYEVVDGKPNLITPAHINLGLAIDMKKPDGTRQLLVPAIKAAESMDFAAFWTAYEEIVRKARDGKLAVTDFQGTTISLTNPGGIGTIHSVPRLMRARAPSSASARWSTRPSGRAPPRRPSPATPSARS